MNKETVVKEVIEILSTSNYIDTSEDLYDGLKQIKREITLNKVHDFLWALESSTVIDMDGKVSECSEKIKSLLEYMNNERYNQIIDEAYENYVKMMTDDLQTWSVSPPVFAFPDFKEVFVNKCKTEPSFSETYGLKIEERELSLEERYNIWFNNNYETGMERFFDPNDPPYFDNPYYEPTPTKLITVTYQENKIEVYELS